MKPVILVVDDDRAMGELLSDVLGAHAFEVLVSQTGNDALTTVAQRADIALVLLDMILQFRGVRAVLAGGGGGGGGGGG